MFSTVLEYEIKVHICNLHSKMQLLMYDKDDGEQSGSQNWRKTSKILEKNIYVLIISIKEQHWRVLKLNFDFCLF